MVHDPLSPSEALRTRLGLAFIVLTFLSVIYALVVVGQPLFGLWMLAVGVGLYLLHRSLAVLDSIADAAQRVAAVREHEAGVESESAPMATRTDSRGDGDAPEDAATSRDAEREWGG